MDRTQGIPRCSNCRGYINCFCTFLENNSKFRCNLCGEESELPQWFRSLIPVGTSSISSISSISGILGISGISNTSSTEGTTPELQYGSYEAVVDNAQFNMKASPVGV